MGGGKADYFIISGRKHIYKTCLKPIILETI